MRERRFGRRDDRGGGRGFGGGGRGFGGGGGFRGGGGYDKPKPVKIGEEYDVHITDVGAKGDGITKVDNFIIFVAGAKKGEDIRIRIKEVANKFAIGEKVGPASGKPQGESEAESEEPAEEEGSEESEESESYGSSGSDEE